jgi:hypothetical protein
MCGYGLGDYESGGRPLTDGLAGGVVADRGRNYL